MRLSEQKWWIWLTKHVGAPYLVAVVLLAPGIFLLVKANNVGWLNAVGGALVGAGLALIISTVGGNQAIHEQFAKEANLRRRDYVYGPLHSEMKSLYEILDNARRGIGPFPRNITPLSDNDTALLMSGLAAPPAPGLQLWLEFKQNYRIYDFTAPARTLLDEVQELAAAYNQAMAPARSVTLDNLAPIIDSAITETQETDEYKEWHRNRSEQAKSAIPLGHAPPSEHDWFRRLEDEQPVGTTKGQAWASFWTNNQSVGWLLASQPDQAAVAAHDTYRPAPSDAPPPPLKWIQHIFRATAALLDSRSEFQKIRAAQDALFAKLSDAVRMLEKGLTDIQNRYEGGTPPV